MFARFRTFIVLAAIASIAAGCSGAKTESSSGQTDATVASSAGFKIGLMTGTVSQNEEEFRAGQQVEAKYPGRVKHVTYPDNFMQEQETVIAQLTGLAADPEVKVIVVGQAVPGSVEAARKIREQRPDILIGFIEPHQDPVLVNAACDIAVLPDQMERGNTIIAEAAAMGAKTFVHYSFPRHMSQELLARRRDIMKAAAAKQGIKFEFVTAPDPMAEGGLPATQQFVLEDVGRELEKFGPATAFFSTNCGMQEPMIKSVLTAGKGYVPEQCCPSPSHGYPGALGISIPKEKAGDMSYIVAENKRIIAEHNMSGHFGSWVAPESMVALRAVVDLLVHAVEQKADPKNMEQVQQYLVAEAGGAPVTIRRYDDNGNQYMVLLDHEVY